MEKHTIHDNETLIAMQDIRQSLAEIAKRAEHGGEFVVVRNSKPSFRIVPYARRRRRAAPSLEEITARFDASGIGRKITPRSLDQIIHEVERVMADGAQHASAGPFPASHHHI